MEKIMRAGLWVLAVVCFMAAGCATVRHEQNVAVIDMEAAINAHPKTKSDSEIWKRQIKALEDEKAQLEEKGQDLVKELEDLEKASSSKALSEKERAKRKKELSEKLVELKEYEKTARATLLEKRNEMASNRMKMLSATVDQISGMVEEYARDNNIVLVMDSASQGANGLTGVVYFVERIDITDDILKELKDLEGGD